MYTLPTFQQNLSFLCSQAVSLSVCVRGSKTTEQQPVHHGTIPKKKNPQQLLPHCRGILHCTDLESLTTNTERCLPSGNLKCRPSSSKWTPMSRSGSSPVTDRRFPCLTASISNPCYLRSPISDWRHNEGNLSESFWAGCMTNFQFQPQQIRDLFFLLWNNASDPKINVRLLLGLDSIATRNANLFLLTREHTTNSSHNELQHGHHAGKAHECEHQGCEGANQVRRIFFFDKASW